MNNLEFVAQKIKLQDPVLLMFDYDGTLTPIVKTSEKAVLASDVRLALECIAKAPSVEMAIISGRTIESVKAVSGISSNQIAFFGLHGGEVLIDGDYCNYATPVHKANIQQLIQVLQESLQLISGVVFEDKTYSIAIHFRQVNTMAEVYFVKKTVATVLKMYNQDNRLRVQSGKKVLEILPSTFHKGRAVDNLVEKYPNHFPIYYGDDMTDIDAFRAVQKYQGLAIGVIVDEDLFSSEESVNMVVTLEALKTFVLTIASTVNNKVVNF